MNVFKSYSSKSAANKAAKKLGQEAIEQDGKWGIMVPQVVTLAEAQAEAELDLVAHAEASMDAIQLSGDVVEIPLTQPGQAFDVEIDADEFHGEGEAPVAVDMASLPKEQHGVKRPQRAGLCWQVWELAYRLQATKGTLPTVAQMREAAPQLNPTNVQIEFYNWRKYNGIRGRQ